MAAASLLGALLVTGCATAPACPPAALAPATPPPAPAPVLVVPDRIAAPAAQAIRRDTNALESQVRSYVYQPGSEADVVRELSPLLRRVREAVARMEARRSVHRAGRRVWRSYRDEDIGSARAAADALANTLHSRAAAMPPPPEPLDLSPLLAKPDPQPRGTPEGLPLETEHHAREP